MAIKIKPWQALVLILGAAVFLGYITIPSLNIGGTASWTYEETYQGWKIYSQVTKYKAVNVATSEETTIFTSVANLKVWIDQQGDEIYYGAAQFKIIQTDYFSGASASPTSAVYTLYHQKPGIGVSGTAITASGTTTEIFKSDAGYVYMSILGGNDFYMVEDSFEANNPRIIESYWEDFDTDGDDDYIHKLWVGDIGVRGQGLTPVCSLTLPLIDEDDGTISDGDPADITGIGATESVQTITWTLSGITAEDGYYLSRLYIATNDTRGGDDVRCEDLTLSGGWTVGGQNYWSMPIHEENGDYEAWYIRPSDYTEAHNALPVYRGTNAADALYVTLSVRCTFEDDDSVQLTLTCDFVQPDGAIDTDSDAVCLTHD